jgi:hypothetical protein
MVRRLLIVALVLLALLGISQLVIPLVVEQRIEDRLTNAGGSADVSVSAFPAARLLFGDGSRIAVTGNGLDLTAEQTNHDVFSRLDGFDQVSVNITHFRTGPFTLASFHLTRDGSEAPYHLATRGTTTPGDLASFGTSQLGLPGGPLAGYLSTQVLGDKPIPINLDMDLQSDGGRIVVVSGGGTVAGLPTGPLAEIITAAVSVQL